MTHRGLDALAKDLRSPIKTFRVDLEQDLDRVTSPPRHLDSRHPRVHGPNVASPSRRVSPVWQPLGALVLRWREGPAGRHAAGLVGEVSPIAVAVVQGVADEVTGLSLGVEGEGAGVAVASAAEVFDGPGGGWFRGLPATTQCLKREVMSRPPPERVSMSWDAGVRHVP